MSSHRNPCPLCGDSNFRSLVDRHGWRRQWTSAYDLQECLGCGFILLSPQPDDAELALAYPDDDYYAYQEHTRELQGKRTPWISRVRAQVRQAVVEAASDPRPWRRMTNPWHLLFGRRFAGIPICPNRQPGRLLDVGCGDGAYLDPLRRMGWDVLGVEMSRKAVERAHALGLPVIQGAFEAVPLSGPFDVIRMWHVVEHVRQPATVLRRARSLLAPRGELILGLPNAASAARGLCGSRWSAWDLPRHLYHYTPKTIHSQLTKEGFEVTAIRHCSVGTLVPSLTGSTTPAIPWRIANLLADSVFDFLRVGDSLEVRATKK